ncbi:hypothetical protein AVEN_208284-1 [Araneus ventricosus]|uniref:Uncharacterized protein n=1 Tax=Araneus ventricosus TaxID=182803 RepID=A0A4Y2P4F6_ARAVE|nr:hypothetical protein AVEN_208284-1 [Araneus ventricosus]
MRFSQYINADLGNSQKKSFIALQKCCSVTYFYHILCRDARLRDQWIHVRNPNPANLPRMRAWWALNRIWRVRNPPAGLVRKFGEGMLAQSSSSDCRKKF